MSVLHVKTPDDAIAQFFAPEKIVDGLPKQRLELYSVTTSTYMYATHVHNMMSVGTFRR